MSTRPNVLLVDDRPDNLLALEAQLRPLEAQFLKAGSGREALDLLLQHEVAVAIVDVQMPEMDGFELAEVMRSSPRTKTIPIMFVTAGPHDRSRVFKGYEAGAVDFLIKPVDPRVLASKVEVFLQLYQQRLALAERVQQLETAERARRESEQRFRQLAEAVPQMVFEINLESGKSYFNRRWTEYTGQEPGDLTSRSQLVHPEDRERMNATWNRALQSGSAYECEYRFRRHDGQYHWILSRALPFKDENGKVTRWFGSATDVHELKAAQEALSEADQRKTEFLAVLSHELRNPLAPIKNSLYILDRAAPGGEQAIRAKEIIVRQVEQLANLVNDLLDVTRITRNKVRLHKESLEVNEVVRRTSEDNRSLFERNRVELHIELSPDPIVVSADRTRLAQVISNLLQNAAKFTPSGGHTRIAVEAGHGAATVRVTDDGIGMAPVTLERLFQPFAQAAQAIDRSGGGLGLGLALVKGLVELHGGQVSARSQGLGKGSEFVLDIPCQSAAGVEQAPVLTHALPEPRRILVIEDNRDAAESLREVLEFDNHQVAVAHDGIQGLRRALEFRPEVVLCDIGLPGMDGYEVARALRADEHLRHVHLVALTGYALPEDLMRAQEAGFQDHLAKPPSIERLVEILARVPSGRNRGPTG